MGAAMGSSGFGLGRFVPGSTTSWGDADSWVGGNKGQTEGTACSTALPVVSRLEHNRVPPVDLVGWIISVVVPLSVFV